MTDPCKTATIVDDVTLQDMTITVKFGSPVTQSFVNYKDNFSSANGNNDGYSICGTRTYTNTCAGHTNVHVSGATSNKVDANLISVSSELDSDVNLTGHSCSLTVSLTDYPNVTHTENFKVIIKYCVIVTYAAQSAIADQTYNIYYDTLTHAATSGELRIPKPAYL